MVELDESATCSDVWVESPDPSLIDVEFDIDADGTLDDDAGNDDDDDDDDNDPGVLFLRAKSLASFEFSGTSLVTVTVSPAKSYVVVIVTILDDDD